MIGLETMMKLLTLSLLLSSCAVACSTDLRQSTAAQAVGEEPCGPFPATGPYSVTYGPDSATLSRADFSAMTAAIHAQKEWAYCVTDLLSTWQQQ
jgi:hypothetical protein